MLKGCRIVASCHSNEQSSFSPLPCPSLPSIIVIVFACYYNNKVIITNYRRFRIWSCGWHEFLGGNCKEKRNGKLIIDNEQFDISTDNKPKQTQIGTTVTFHY